MNSDTIDLQRNGFIAALVINRPTELNTLTPEMLEQLLAHCHTLETDSKIRAVLLTGASKKAFCVGTDIHRWTSLSALDMQHNWIRRGYQAFDALAQLSQPVIVLLRGLAYGGSPGLVVATDIRICGTETQMALPKIGLTTVPDQSGTQRLTALLGRSLVKELVFTGEPLDAQRALSCGLVNRVVTKGALHDAGLQLTQRIAQRTPVAVQIAKQVIDAGEGIAVASTLEALAGVFSTTTEDAHEGSQTFTGERQPHFNVR